MIEWLNWLGKFKQWLRPNSKLSGELDAEYTNFIYEELMEMSKSQQLELAKTLGVEVKEYWTKKNIALEILRYEK